MQSEKKEVITPNPRTCTVLSTLKTASPFLSDTRGGKKAKGKSVIAFYPLIWRCADLLTKKSEVSFHKKLS